MTLLMVVNHERMIFLKAWIIELKLSCYLSDIKFHAQNKQKKFLKIRTDKTSDMVCIYFIDPFAKVQVDFPSQILGRRSHSHHLKASCKKLLGLNIHHSVIIT